MKKKTKYLPYFNILKITSIFLLKYLGLLVLHYCRELDWLPTNWGETKTKLLSTQDMSMNSLVERQAVFHSVWNEINDYIREEYFNGVPSDISTKHYYDLIKLLVEKKKIPTNEWLKISSLKAVNEDPLNKFVTIKGDWICFDEEAFRNLPPDSMYYWHFKAVHELQ